MKKILFISTILIAFSLNTIKAQEKFKVSYGGGINYFIPDDTAFTESNFMYGSFNNSPWFSQEYNLKFSYNVFNNLYIGTGAGIFGKSVKLKDIYYFVDMNTTYKADTKITFNYLEIPLFFEYEFNKSKKLFPYIQLCFSYNKILYVKEKVLSVETHATEYYFENIFLINQSLTLGYLNYKTISGNINAGLKYNIYKNFYIGIHAGIKYSKILKETNYLQPAGLIFKANLNLEIKL